ncbi:MAG: hypothetical protein HY365_03680 [Candidatus Aenigmarchaeota archaeon]|nr:hypothetical protein [Candidatus Aenigmarchaeota archaeon]
MRFWLVFALLFAVNAGFAATMELEKTSYRVPLGATEAINIMLNGTANETTLLSVGGEKTWTILSVQSVALEKGERKNVTLFLSPGREVIANVNYKFTITARTLGSGEETSETIFVFVSKDEFVDIDRTSVSGQFYPTGTIAAKAYVKNFKRASVQDVSVNMTFRGPQGVIAIESTKIPLIDPTETNEAGLTFTVPDNMPKGAYRIIISISAKDLQTSAEQEFDVEEKAVLDERVEPVAFLTGYGQKITVVNRGNVAGSHSVERAVSDVERMFFSGTEPSEKSAMYVWNVDNLGAGASAEIEYKIDFLPAVLTLVALIAAAWYILYKLRIVHLRKYIIQKKVIQEGTEFTVGVDVKNWTGATTDVNVRDFVPPIFRVREHEGFKFQSKKTAYGTEIKWALKDVKNWEERVLSYKIVPTLGVNSPLNLPPARGSYVQGTKTLATESKPAPLGILKRERKE